MGGHPILPAPIYILAGARRRHYRTSVKYTPLLQFSGCPNNAIGEPPSRIKPDPAKNEGGIPPGGNPELGAGEGRIGIPSGGSPEGQEAGPAPARAQGWKGTAFFDTKSSGLGRP